jgi:hypothetical protein
VLWIPIKKELQNTSFYKFICCIEQQEGWNGEDSENKEVALAHSSSDMPPTYQSQAALKQSTNYQSFNAVGYE